MGSGKEEESGVAVLEALPDVRVVVEMEGGLSARERGGGGEGASRLSEGRSCEREEVRGSGSVGVEASSLEGRSLRVRVSRGPEGPSSWGMEGPEPLACLVDEDEGFWEREGSWEVWLEFWRPRVDWERCIAPRAGELPPLAATANEPMTGEEARSGELTADAFVPVLIRRIILARVLHQVFNLLTSA